MTTTDAAEAVAAWLATPEGRARVVGALDRRRLPASLADDLASDVVVAALGATEPIEEPPAWATTVLVRRSIDLARARARRPVVSLDEWADAGFEAIDDAAGPDHVELEAPGDDVRRALAAVQPVAVRSAALTAVTVALDDPALPTDCPQPGAGASASDAPLWAGVWFAGGWDCWTEPDTDATRKRRSRAVSRARAALAEALGATS
jgi:hypothetical protein